MPFEISDIPISVLSKYKNISISLHTDDSDNGTNHRILQNAMFAIMNEFATIFPRLHATKRKNVFDRRFVLHRCLQVHLQLQKVQQILHEIVNDIGLVAFAGAVEIERMFRVDQTEPLCMREER